MSGLEKLLLVGTKVSNSTSLTFLYKEKWQGFQSNRKDQGFIKFRWSTQKEIVKSL